MRRAILVVLVVGILASVANPSTSLRACPEPAEGTGLAGHPLLGEHNPCFRRGRLAPAHAGATLDPSLSTSNETLREAILQAVRAASTGDSLPPLKVDYPLDEAVFPPDMAAPTFVWSDPAAEADTWLIEVVSGDSSDHLYVLTQGATPPRARDDDPRTLSKAAAAYKPPAPMSQASPMDACPGHLGADKEPVRRPGRDCDDHRLP